MLLNLLISIFIIVYIPIRLFVLKTQYFLSPDSNIVVNFIQSEILNQFYRVHEEEIKSFLKNPVCTYYLKPYLLSKTIN